jgi:hypothetical protein
MSNLQPRDFLTEIGATRSMSTLDSFSRVIWAEHHAGRLTDDDAQACAEALEARRREVRGIDTVGVRAPSVATAAKANGRPSHFPPKRRAARSPDRAKSIARRRLLAASGAMPPTLACDFTAGEQAVLRIIADEVRDKGCCALPMGAIAARAGVCETLARKALRMAARLGHVTIEERRRHKAPNRPNVVRIISREWLAWIKRGVGCKKVWATDKGSFRTLSGDRVSRGQHPLKEAQDRLEHCSGTKKDAFG